MTIMEAPQVTRRLTAALEDLLKIAPADRRPVLEEQRALLRRAVAEADFDERVANFALASDAEGIGDRASRR